MGILFIGQACRSCKFCDIICDPLDSDDGKTFSWGYICGEFWSLTV